MKWIEIIEIVEFKMPVLMYFIISLIYYLKV